MKSSGYDPASYDWSDEYYQISLREIRDHRFDQHMFTPGPALVARRAQGGYREEIEYHGQEFDPQSYELVQGRWDHQHCVLCRFPIKAGCSYWVNRADTILCDVCHDHVLAE
jgi:hypothetical protein